MSDLAMSNVQNGRPSKQLYLEFVRGTVAILVFISHIVELLPPVNNSPDRFFISFVGTDSVMIFFLLSGCVIHISQSRKPKSQVEFFKNRLLRLYPQFIIGVAMGLVALSILKMPRSSFPNTLGNIFMLSTLQGYIAKCIQTNSPIWTLTFEMFFYIIFILCIGGNTRKKVWIWFVAGLLLMPCYYLNLGNRLEKHLIIILVFSTIWIVGYLVYEYRKYFYAGPYTALISFGMLPAISRLHLFNMYYDPLNYLLFAFAAIPFFRFCLKEKPSGYRIKIGYVLGTYLLVCSVLFLKHDFTRLSSKIIYSLLPALLALFYYVSGFFRLRDRVSSIVNSVGSVTGKYSYSLYIIHYPILNLCSYFIHNKVVYVLSSIVLVAVMCYLLESIYQPAVGRAIRRQDSPRPQLA